MRTAARRGMAIYLVVALLMFGAILSYALNAIMLQQSAAGQLSVQRLLARSLTRSLLALTSTVLATELNDPTSSLYALLSAPTPIPNGTDITPASLSTPLAGVLAGYPGATGTVKVTVVSSAPIDQPGQLATFGVDPLEQNYQVNFSIDATCGLAARHTDVAKNIRFQNLVPLSLTKFTLWANQLTPANPNIAQTDFVGNQVSSPLPVIFHNEGTLPPAYTA